MTQTTPSISKPTRGIIVVDTSVLLRICFPLSDDFLTEQTQGTRVALTDTLITLAKNGYKVIIPEMVANECGGFMRDGTTISDYFNTLSNPTQKITYNFFKSIAAAKEDGADIVIHPPLDTDKSPQAQYLRELWRLREFMIENPDCDLIRAHPKLLRKAIISVRKQYSVASRKPDRGDIAAHEIIANIKEPNIPIFYLSDDRKFCQIAAQLRSDVPVNILTALGFYEALKTHELLPSLENKMSKQLANYYWSRQNDYGIASNHPNIAIIDKSPEEIIAQFSVQTAEEIPAELPFSQSLTGLKEEIDKKEQFKNKNLLSDSPTLIITNPQKNPQDRRINNITGSTPD